MHLPQRLFVAAVAAVALVMACPAAADAAADASASDAAIDAKAQEANADVITLQRAHLDFVGNQTIGSQELELPLHWDVAFAGASGHAELRMPFDSPPAWLGGTEPYTVFVTRLGSAYAIRLNGTVLAEAGELDARGDAWSAKQPLKVNFPSSLLQAHNELMVDLRVDAGRRSGLSVVYVGPAHRVTPIASHARFLRVVWPQAASVFSLLVAAFCALLWWQHRDPLYAWAGFGEALWAVAVADTIIEEAPLPWPWWGLAVVMSRAMWSWSLFAVAREVFAMRMKREGRALAAVVISTPFMIGLAVVLRSTSPLVVYQIGHFVAWFVIIAVLLMRTLRAPNSERVMLFVAIVACIGSGVRDMLAARFVAAYYDESAWIKYVATMVGAAVMWIVSMRFRQARQEVLQLNDSLSQRVEQKEAELRQSFARLAEVERSRAVLAERERILRDMHDGVGANLATAVRQLESGQARAGEVAQTLRESMDHLKLSIDAMSLPPGDVNALLASLRYRLQPRIESAGIELEWQVDALPRWHTGTDEAMRHLQFLLLEAISNSLQHAAATRLTLAARSTGDQIELTLSDDGRGMAETAGRGLRSMRERAAAIGARLSVEPAQPGTSVRVSLDLAAKSAA